MGNTENPPKRDGRYRKGTTGNPKGRPRKTAPRRISLLDYLVTIEFEGRTYKVSPDVAAVATLWDLGLGGSSRSMEAYLKNRKKIREPAQEARDKVRIIYRLPMRIGRADNALGLLRIRKIDDGMYKVGNWVVDEALKRNPRPNLEGRDLKELAKGTENPGLTYFKLVCAQLDIPLSGPPDKK